MTTTNLFVELLIIGAEALVWSFLLGATIFGWSHKDAFHLLAEHPLLGIPLAICCYVCGIMLDRLVAGLVFRSAGHRVRKRALERVRGKALKPHEARQIWVAVRTVAIVGPDGLRSVLEYFRHRVRIMRAGTLNFVIIAVSGALFLHLRAQVNLEYVVGWIALNVGIAGISLFSWLDLCRGHCTLAYRHYLSLKNSENEKQPQEKNAKKDSTGG